MENGIATASTALMACLPLTCPNEEVQVGRAIKGHKKSKSMVILMYGTFPHFPG